MDGNFIKLDRKILEWDWYTDINTSRLFIHMLLKANWKDGNFRGVVIQRGSFVSSIGKLAEETMLTEREVRTAISHLKSTGEVTSKSSNKYTVFTVKNYDKYQSSDKQNDIQPPVKRQANDIQSTTIEEGKKGRKEEYTSPISPVVRFEEFWAAYPKKGSRYLAEAEYCNAVLSGVPEADLVNAAKNYADHCRKERKRELYIKNPENFIRDNVFINFVKGERHGESGENTGTDEKSINDIMLEQGICGDFEGF